MTALTERYRPSALTDVIGQSDAVGRLDLIRARYGTLGGRAYWLAGPSGTGKTTIARIIAAEVADPFATDELDASGVTADYLRQVECRYGIRPVGGRGWAIIVNEAHGLRGEQLRRLLTVIEPDAGLPPWVVWCFTTTDEGERCLFDGMDAKPLVSRCTVLPMAHKDLVAAMAKRAKEIAEAESLDGRPLPDYLQLVYRHKANMRAVLQAIEAGEMLTNE